MNLLTINEKQLMEHEQLVFNGIADILNGNESYAGRYLEGVMYSNDVGMLKNLDGMEGLLATVGEKIKRFLTWLWTGFKKVFGFLFGSGKVEFKLLVGQAALDEKDRGWKLKTSTPTSISSELLKVMNNVSGGLDHLKFGLDNLQRNTTAHADKWGPALKNMHVEPFSVYHDKWMATVELLNGNIRQIEHAASISGLGKGLFAFFNHMNEFADWSLKHQPHHKAQYIKNYTEVNDLAATNKAIDNDLAHLDEKDQSDCGIFIVQAVTLGQNYFNIFNSNKTAMMSIIRKINSNEYFVKK